MPATTLAYLPNLALADEPECPKQSGSSVAFVEEVDR